MKEHPVIESFLSLVEKVERKELIPVSDILEYGGAGTLKEAGLFDKPCFQHYRDKLTLYPWWHGLLSSGMQNSHYTIREAIASIWELALFHVPEPEAILDPGCGTGRFGLLAPIPVKGKYMGVEKCEIAAAIARSTRDELFVSDRDFVRRCYAPRFDLIVGNVPFVGGTQTMTTPNLPRSFKVGLHLQFLLQAIASLRPGGIMVVLTSTMSLDARGKEAIAARKWMASQGELVAAYRLPPGVAFEGETQACCDLIVFKKQSNSKKRCDKNRFVEVVPVEVEGKTCHLNEYFFFNPRNILGYLCLAPTNGHQLAIESSKDSSLVWEELLTKHKSKQALKHKREEIKMPNITVTIGDEVIVEGLARGSREDALLENKGFVHCDKDGTLVGKEELATFAKAIARKNKWTIIKTSNKLDKLADAIAEKVAEKLQSTSSAKEVEELEKALTKSQAIANELAEAVKKLKEELLQSNQALKQFKEIAISNAGDYEDILGENIVTSAWEEYLAISSLEDDIHPSTSTEDEEEIAEEAPVEKSESAEVIEVVPEPEPDDEDGFNLDLLGK